MAVGQEKAGLVGDSAIKAMGAFGGGIAATGGTCGILIGGVALVSSMYSRARLEEKEDPRMWSLNREFIKKFEKLTQLHGGMNCRDIAGVNWKDKATVKDYYSNPESRRKICIQLVGDAAFALGELLELAESESK